MARRRRVRKLTWRTNGPWPTLAASSRGKGGAVTRKRRKTRTGGLILSTGAFGLPRRGRSRKRFLGLL